MSPTYTPDQQAGIVRAREKLRRVAAAASVSSGDPGNPPFLAAIEDPTNEVLYNACFPEFRDVLRMALVEQGVPLYGDMAAENRR